MTDTESMCTRIIKLMPHRHTETQTHTLTHAGLTHMIAVLRSYPKSSIAVSAIIVIGALYRYHSCQKYPAPWLDQRKLKSGLTKKQVLRTDFKAEQVGTDEWDAVVIGSGGSGLITANLMSRAGLKGIRLSSRVVTSKCSVESNL